MKRALMFVVCLLSIFGCKEADNLTTDDKEINDINIIRTDFNKRTNYNELDSNFINPNFKSIIDWNTFQLISEDTIYIKVKILDKVEVVWDTCRIDIDDKVWIRAVNNKKEWDYKILTFIKEDNYQSYSGAIISQSLLSDMQGISFFQNDEKINQKFKLRAGWAPIRECVNAYVQGEFNRVYCRSNSNGGGGDWGSSGGGGSPGDWGNVDPGRGAAGGGSRPSNPIPPTASELKAQIKDKPFALIPNIPCDIIKKWLATARHEVQQSQIDKLNQIRFSTTQVPWAKSEVIARVQKINDAYSSVVNMDYFPITVSQLPVVNGKRLTPAEFIKYIRLNINNFINTDYSSFAPYNFLNINDTNLWNTSNPINAVVGIDIPGLFGPNDNFFDDDAAVIVSKSDASGWTFTTIFDPIYGAHPVSGNRDFGFMQNSNGSYTFYTRGVDRLTDNFGSALQQLSGTPFTKADQLWTSFQNMVSGFVNQHGGAASVAQQEIHRPNWTLVKDVIDGKEPLSTLSSDCK